MTDRYEVREEELPSDEYDNEVNHWYVYDHQTDSVVDNEWFDTEKRAQDYLDWILNKTTMGSLLDEEQRETYEQIQKKVNK
jgi:IS1 family transposase